jgi:peroxiredoxin
MSVQTVMRPAILVVAAVLALAGLVPGRSSARVGGRLPDFALPAVPGTEWRGRFDLGDHLERDVVVVLFWATWCQPCRHELPFYQTLYERHREQGLVVVGISMDASNTIAQAGPWARRLGLTYPVVSDLDTSVTNRINPRRAAPFSIWVGRDGRITREREGFSLSEREEISRGIAELVATRN